MLGQLSRSQPVHYNPETDAPAAAGHFVITSYSDFILATVALPLLCCLLAHLLSSRQKTSQAAAHGQEDSSSRRQRRQAAIAAARAGHQPRAHMDSQQRTPATNDRPFRQSKSTSRQAATPQSDRPFRITQTQRVYSTPDSADRNQQQYEQQQQHQQPYPAAVNGTPSTAPVGGAGAPVGSQAPTSDRPFRVSHATRTPLNSSQGPQHSTSPAAGHHNILGSSSPGGSARLFSFRPSTEIERLQQQQQQTSPGGPHTRVPQEAAGWGSSSQQSPQFQRFGLPQQDLVAGAGQQQDWEEGDQEQVLEEQQQEGLPDWDPSLLASCARNARYISSLEGLQQSPEYTQHIRNVRKQQLTYEDKELQKLKVYKALRRVDPDSFKQLFSRKEVLEYDELPLSRWLALLEFILSTALSFALLGLPFYSTALQPHQQGLAILWGLLTFWAVWFKGCTSVSAWALGVYATQGPYGMSPSCLRLVLAASVEAALAAVAPVFPLGVLASLACRLLTQQRQSCGERLLRLQPMREVVRPMHFSPYTRGSARYSARSSMSDAEE